MTWHIAKTVEVHNDKWDLPEGVPVPLARTGLSQRFMRRVGNRLEVSAHE